jgi:hypothetical protein
MFSNPYTGDPTAPNFVGPPRLPNATEPAGDIFVMVDGNIVRVGGSNNDLPGNMVDNSYNDFSFYQSIQNARNVDDRREAAEAPNEILNLVKNIFEIFKETE